jgi:hypothetical protein
MSVSELSLKDAVSTGENVTSMLDLASETEIELNHVYKNSNPM